MEITVNKCEQCGALFESDSAYKKHIEKHNIITVINGAFPPVADKNCKFANGGWSMQRSKKWLADYKDRITEAVGIKDYPPFSYGWFRCLDDSGDMLYGVACRVLNICPKCYLEWGQPYYANNCDHQAKKK